MTSAVWSLRQSASSADKAVMNDFSLIAVFFVGLLGGVHCLGMCGSIVGVFTAQVPQQPSPEPSPASGRGANRLAPAVARDRRFSGARWPFHLAYSSGRIASYALAGALVGALGSAGLL